MTLEELRVALAKATGPDRGLDTEIAMALDPAAAGQGVWLDYTDSLDAAVTLVPDGWEWNMSKSAVGRFCCFIRDGNHRTATQRHEGYGETAALALCLARVEYELQKQAGAKAA